MVSRILIVDDEDDLAELVAFRLQQLGHVAATTGSGIGALMEVQRKRPDLMVLDLMLPDLSGTEVCRRIRRDAATRDIPIVMVTAKTDEVDRVVGFEVGADDYVTKPFSPRELVLRIEAVLRRTQPTSGVSTLQIGDLWIDAKGHRVRVRGIEAPLTALEFRLLLDLAERKGRVQSRDALLERVWGYVSGTETRTVDTHIKRLRRKLSTAADQVETIRGVGYRLRE